MTYSVLREVDVVRRTRLFLRDEGLAGQRTLDLYTNAHPTLTGNASLSPFQRFALDLDGVTVYPDLVSRLDDGETTLAVEVPVGSVQWLRQRCKLRASTA